MTCPPKNSLRDAWSSSKGHLGMPLTTCAISSCREAVETCSGPNMPLSGDGKIAVENASMRVSWETLDVGVNVCIVSLLVHTDFCCSLSLTQDHHTAWSSVKSGRAPWFSSGSLQSTQGGLQSLVTLWTWRKPVPKMTNGEVSMRQQLGTSIWGWEDALWSTACLFSLKRKATNTKLTQSESGSYIGLLVRFHPLGSNEGWGIFWCLKLFGDISPEFLNLALEGSHQLPPPSSFPLCFDIPLSQCLFCPVLKHYCSLLSPKGDSHSSSNRFWQWPFPGGCPF